MNSGYPVEQFTEKMDDFLCGVCSDVCIDASSLSCGHLYCHDCIESALLRNRTCPLCRKSADDGIHPSHWHRRKINGSMYRCSHLPCVTIDALERVLHHETECFYRPQPCEYCLEIISYEKRESHVGECVPKVYICDLCLETVRQADMILHHETCSGVEIDCSCGVIVERGKLAEHQDVCPREIIKCCYHEYGCDFLTVREEMKEHENEIKHMHLLLEEINRLKNRVQYRLYPGIHTTYAHEHPVLFCCNVLHQPCSQCGKHMEPMNNFPTGIGYRCIQDCNVILCIECFEVYWKIPE